MKIEIRNVSYYVLLFMAVVFLGSCSKDDTDYSKEFEEKEEEEEIPVEEKARYIWVDAAANFIDFANSRENIKRDLTLAKEAGFTDIVVDVRPSMGDVLFQTDVAPQVEKLQAWLPSGFSDVNRTATFDYLQAFIEEGHALDLKIHAAINTFSGGNRNSLGNHGLLFRDTDKREWATQLLTDSGIQNTLELSDSGAKFFNPVHEEVQEYILDMLEDLAAYQDLDGIFLDRGRFDGMDSDFSDYTKQKFEEFLGHSVSNFPEAVMTPEIIAGGPLPAETPEYFKPWMEFRSQVIHDFMEAARNRVKAVNPEVDFGVYVGAWYGSYYGVGVNWASPRYNTAADFPKWASANYKNTGYADHMDVILIGAYAAPTRIYGSSEWTVEGFCSLAVDKIRGDAVVIGGPDIGNGDWATSSDAVVEQAIVQSVDAAINASDGYFLFDMIHLKKKNQWRFVREGLDKVYGEE